jgi:hypothetical protein
MANDGIDHKYFRDPRRISDTPFEVHSSVLDEILCFTHSVLKGARPRFEPSSEKRRRSDVGSHSVITIIRSSGQSENGNRIAVVEPEHNCSLKLRSSCRFFGDYQSFSRGFRVWFRFWGHWIKLAHKVVFGFLLFVLFVASQLFLEELSPLLYKWVKALALVAIGVTIAGYVVARGVDVIAWITANKITIDAHIVDTFDGINNGEDSAEPGGIYRFNIGRKTFEGETVGDYEIGDTVRVLYNPRTPNQNHAEADRRKPLNNYFTVLLVSGFISFFVIAAGTRRIRDILLTRKLNLASRELRQTAIRRHGGR